MDGAMETDTIVGEVDKTTSEATAGFEPAMGVLQTPALPLGYVA